jgi:hypothetical protein
MDVVEVDGKEYRYPMLPLNVCIMKESLLLQQFG